MANSTEAHDSSGSPEESPRFPALSVLRMFWKRRWLICSLWVLGSLFGFALVYTIAPVYRAEAVVLVDSQKIPEAFVSPTVNGDVADRLALITQTVMTS